MGKLYSFLSALLLTVGLTRAAATDSYEYWIDDDYDSKTSGRVSSATNVYTFNFETLQKGLHRFNYRMMTETGIWGAPYTKYFFHPDNEEHSSEYEYWLDNDFEDRIKFSAEANTLSFSVDLSSFDKSTGAHYFQLRMRKDNEWGPVYRKLIIFTEDEQTPRIIGYRHFINDINLGYMDVDSPAGKTFSFKVSLPDRGTIMGGKNENADVESHKDSVRYVVQLKSERGWMAPVSWDLDLDKLTSKSVRFAYNGRYLMLETDEENAEIHYALLGKESEEEGVYTEKIDMGGLTSVNAWTVRPGYNDSDKAQYDVRYYADEEHAETADGGLLASAFEWDESKLPNRLETFRVVGKLNNTDYAFIRSMSALRHLDLEKVSDANLPDYAFLDSKLISISMPEDLTEYGESIFSNASRLSSVIWNSTSKNIEDGLTSSLANPNVLLYVPAGVTVTNYSDINEVHDGTASSIILHYGFPFHAARDFRADVVSLTHDFKETTKMDTCRGWETIVLPFSPTEITHEVNGPAVPFAAWNGDLEGDKPFWLHRATSEGWEEAVSIEACVPYIISMPNNPDYVKEFNLGGKVTFTAYNADLGPAVSTPGADNWTDGTMFEGTFMPVEEEGLLSLNVGSTEGDRQPGSTFVADSHTSPFGAYVRGAAGRKAMPIFGDESSVEFATDIDCGLLIETPAPGILKISCGRECNVSVTTITGVTIRTLHLKAGETVTLDGLTRDLYIVAGVKVMVR